MNSEHLIKSIAKYSIASIVNFAINVLFVILATRLFEPSIYGQINIFNTSSRVMLAVCCIGLDNAFIRFYNEPPVGWDRRRLLLICLGVSFAVVLVSGIIASLCWYDIISNKLFGKISFVITVLLVVNTLSLTVFRYLAICYRMADMAKQFVTQSILVQFFSRFFVLVSCFFNPSIEIVLFTNCIGLLVISIVYLKLQWSEFFPDKVYLNFEKFRDIGKFAVTSWPQQSLNQLNSFLPVFLISSYINTEAVGLFSCACFFSAACGVLQSGFGTYWSSYMYSHYKTDNMTIQKTHDYMTLVVVVLIAVFIIFQHVAYLMIGDAYQSSREFFALLITTPLLLLLTETTCYGISISKKVYISSLIFLAMLIVNGMISVVFLPILGVSGAAWGVMCSGLVYFVLMSYFGNKYYTMIRHPLRTAYSVGALEMIAITNCIFVNNYLMEIFIVFIILISIVIVYKNELMILINDKKLFKLLKW